ncbi:3-keto-disaccharide hydrolase [Mariniblastus fucicola]|uniref:3-keto-alpha-glucoside-1,2-lyase/3-keto-2-hydroxy-glucal hydratase domain-containing protein n=1 Tax=Mariniblastus fucicola TaxID=980251 RepID=A0A5B9PF84_9BACT|nr:DUF1080 domain-containing protein [Mariniblastus fucicola]QEG23855.1 hypothetical protein MFFC18_37590 [Mariniblastus fucicola]
MMQNSGTGKIHPFWTQFQLLIVCITTIFSASTDALAQAEPAGRSAASIKTAGLSQDEIDSGWIALFDGESTFGWRAASEANWTVEQGVVSVSEGDKGLLRTTSQFDNFELKARFKIPAETNSGIFIRTSPKPRDPAGDCYEINLASKKVSPFPTGTLVSRSKGEDVSNGNAAWFEQWHDIHISANGPKIIVHVDGQEVTNYTDPAGDKAIGRGYIGLQLNSGLAQFKSVRLKPLNVEPIFNGTDLTGWKTDQKLDSSFEVTEDGELQILSGRGQIESEATFGDFVFSMKCKTNADGLNSGVFFRSIPGEMMNGYESQIQNQFKDSDRSKPVDCGTGGIFRRSVARHVNANDKEWFSKTIIANGPRVAVWINGYQVTDWSDQREPDNNPRRGQRLEAGTIIFQGHDPTTDILIKNIGARELKPRNR